MTDSTNPPPQFPDPEFNPNIPPLIRESISNLSENVNAMLSSMASIKGNDYANHVAGFFTLTEQLKQIEEIACDSTRLLMHAANATDNPNLAASARLKHATAHILCDNVHAVVNAIMDHFSKLPGHENFMQDLQSLKDRAQVDYHSKIAGTK